MSPILLLFIDGIGLGETDPAINPFATAFLPTFNNLLGGSQLVARSAGTTTDQASLRALDATLGIPGLPQSGTGQTALFTGENAPQIFGRHFGPWVPTPLRSLLGERNVLTLLKQSGRSVAFANAYPEEVFQPGRKQRDPLRAGPPIAALGAGVLNRHTPELQRGDAIASEIINEGWRLHLDRTALPVITARQAGHNLARIAATHDFTLFAHYSTDHVGHTNDMAESIKALERVDEFLGGILENAADDLTIVLASDHGNLEDIRAGHTLNPAIGLFVGAHHRELAENATSLTDVAPAILKLANAQ
jgi:2,3-bisphosphoglycerate-independent phosphoglycerate mutase